MTSEVQLPARVDVAVIGGGIAGVSTAYALAKDGISVAVFEKGTIGCEQSSRNWGWVRTLGRDMPEVPLAIRASELWGDIQRHVDVGFRRTGLLYLAESQADTDGHQEWLERARSYGVDAMLLGREAVLQRLPVTNRPWTGGLFSAGDGVAEPSIAMRGIAHLAKSLGCRIFEHCAVRGLDLAAGRVSGVVTEHGRVQAGTVLLAGGAWSRLLCGNSGVSFPQLKVRASVLRTVPVAGAPDVTLNGKDFACSRRADGGYTVSQFRSSIADLVPDSFKLFPKFFPSWLANNTLVKLRAGRRFFEELSIPTRFDLGRRTPFEEHRTLVPPAGDGAATALRKLARSFPAFRGATIAEAWGGYIDVTPDALPVMSPVPAIPGFYLASGFSGHGFGIGPAVGEFMANMIQGRPLSGSAQAFRLDRF